MHNGSEKEPWHREKASLDRLKLDLKTWERGFYLEHGRKATVDDMLTRSRILALSQKYQELKKSVAEQQETHRREAERLSRSTESALRRRRSRSRRCSMDGIKTPIAAVLKSSAPIARPDVSSLRPSTRTGSPLTLVASTGRAHADLMTPLAAAPTAAAASAASGPAPIVAQRAVDNPFGLRRRPSLSAALIGSPGRASTIQRRIQAPSSPAQDDSASVSASSPVARRSQGYAGHGDSSTSEASFSDGAHGLDMDDALGVPSSPSRSAFLRSSRMSYMPRLHTNAVHAAAFMGDDNHSSSEVPVVMVAQSVWGMSKLASSSAHCSHDADDEDDNDSAEEAHSVTPSPAIVKTEARGHGSRHATKPQHVRVLTFSAEEDSSCDVALPSSSVPLRRSGSGRALSSSRKRLLSAMRMRRQREEEEQEEQEEQEQAELEKLEAEQQQQQRRRQEEEEDEQRVEDKIQRQPQQRQQPQASQPAASQPLPIPQAQPAPHKRQRHTNLVSSNFRRQVLKGNRGGRKKIRGARGRPTATSWSKGTQSSDPSAGLQDDLCGETNPFAHDDTLCQSIATEFEPLRHVHLERALQSWARPATAITTTTTTITTTTTAVTTPSSCTPGASPLPATRRSPGSPLLADPSVDIDAELTRVLQAHWPSFTGYRPGQLPVLRRLVQGLSTLAVLPTGAGKSLCYQVPAALTTNSFVLVVSPLLSLMKDQVNRLPSSLPGGALSHHQSAAEMVATLDDVKSGRVRILFVAPERLASRAFLQVLPTLPRVSLVCVDEAHCISQWSHNFRTSYLCLRSLLLTHNCLSDCPVLGLTATATKRTEVGICDSLCIEGNGVVRLPCVRPNLRLHVTRTRPDRHKSLLMLMRSEPLATYCSGGNGSVIIYTMFQREAKNVAEYLCRERYAARAYHGGMSSKARQRIQAEWTAGGFPIMVATVAFGMGIDKSDVRSVIHWSLPKSVESYVQEVGRAGRDGCPSEGHLLLSDEDYVLLRSYAHSDGVSMTDVCRFLEEFVFPADASLVGGTGATQGDSGDEGEAGSHGVPCKGKRRGRKRARRRGRAASAGNGDGDDVVVVCDARFGISTAEGQVELDMKKEVMSTLLTWLQLDGWIQQRETVLRLATISYMRVPEAQLAEKDPIIAWAKKHGKRRPSDRREVDVLEVARALSWNVLDVQARLGDLKASGHIKCCFSDSALTWVIHRIPRAKKDVAHRLCTRLRDLERLALSKLALMYNVAREAADLDAEMSHGSDDGDGDGDGEGDANDRGGHAYMEDVIQRYFECADVAQSDLPIRPPMMDASMASERVVKADVRAFLAHTRGTTMSGRAVARIFHGVSSPAFPASRWATVSEWRRHRKVGFDKLARWATECMADVNIAESKK